MSLQDTSDAGLRTERRCHGGGPPRRSCGPGEEQPLAEHSTAREERPCSLPPAPTICPVLPFGRGHSKPVTLGAWGMGSEAIRVPKQERVGGRGEKGAGGRRGPARITGARCKWVEKVRIRAMCIYCHYPHSMISRSVSHKRD